MVLCKKALSREIWGLVCPSWLTIKSFYSHYEPLVANPYQKKKKEKSSEVSFLQYEKPESLNPKAALWHYLQSGHWPLPLPAQTAMDSVSTGTQHPVSDRVNDRIVQSFCIFTCWLHSLPFPCSSQLLNLAGAMPLFPICVLGVLLHPSLPDLHGSKLAWRDSEGLFLKAIRHSLKYILLMAKQGILKLDNMCSYSRCFWIHRKFGMRLWFVLISA